MPQVWSPAKTGSGLRPRDVIVTPPAERATRPEAAMRRPCPVTETDAPLRMIVVVNKPTSARERVTTTVHERRKCAVWSA